MIYLRGEISGVVNELPEIGDFVLGNNGVVQLVLGYSDLRHVLVLPLGSAIVYKESICKKEDLFTFFVDKMWTFYRRNADAIMVLTETVELRNLRVTSKGVSGELMEMVGKFSDFRIADVDSFVIKLALMKKLPSVMSYSQFCKVHADRDFNKKAHLKQLKSEDKLIKAEDLIVGKFYDKIVTGQDGNFASQNVMYVGQFEGYMGFVEVNKRVLKSMLQRFSSDKEAIKTRWMDGKRQNIHIPGHIFSSYFRCRLYKRIPRLIACSDNSIKDTVCELNMPVLNTSWSLANELTERHYNLDNRSKVLSIELWCKPK